ncbi:MULTISPECIES: hypothetical protein [Pseudomonas]|uniref:hypothetical protein n=1 Tax=Pseudomonas TaxID=286 RepID=UPI00087849C2|nr:MULTISPECIES: hypothetical protein [Pseudomonas]AOX10490.1 hypothetical protein Q5O_19580 [Pseudomonas putida JB]MCI1024061.1 hypothetical protein [Pseudomonas putida]MDN4514244.1 hypothetical protein [Pseudomonas sp. 2,4-D]SIS17938.1 hypothetical protein SAMN05216501_4933 [Pseudomonas putida]
MSRKYKIVHISQTPLVAAPAKVALAQRLIGHDSIAIALNDYPNNGPLFQKFIEDYIVETEFTKPLIDAAIREADIIQIHNDLPPAWAERLIHANQAAKYFYQVHSPLREGPLYVPRQNDINLPFLANFVVGQFQPRIHNNHIFVPNIIHDAPMASIRQKGEKLRVIFSPTHLRPGRWNNKYVAELETAMNSLVSLGKIEAVVPDKPVSPKVLMAVRKTCHVTIDEIATGGFHQVSIEGLAAGNVTINRADYFSKAVFSTFADGNKPPFFYATGESIADTLHELANDWKKTAELQEASLDYFKSYLTPEKMARVFDNAYENF